MIAKTLMPLKQEGIEWDISSDQLMLKNLSSSTMKMTLDEHNIPLQQNMEKAKAKFKHVDNVWDIFEDQRQKSAGPVVQYTQASKIRKTKVAPLEVKVDLFSSIGLGGAQQLLSISQCELFFIHPA